MNIEIKELGGALNVKHIFLNGVLVGVVGISGGFTYLRSAKVTYQEDDAIMEALRDFYSQEGI